MIGPQSIRGGMFCLGDMIGSYLRIMALGCIDVVLVLPLSILLLVQGYAGSPLPFWPGWDVIHSDWGPVSVPADEWKPFPWDNFEVRWDEWINVLLAVIFFSLFGVTEEALAAMDLDA